MKTNLKILLLTMAFVLITSFNGWTQCDNDSPSDCPNFTLSMSGTQESCERGKVYIYINWSEAVSLIGIDMEMEITLNGGMSQTFEFHEVITDESIFSPLTEAGWFEYDWDGGSRTYTLDGDDGTENLCVDFPSGVTKLMSLYFDSNDEVEIEIKTGTVSFEILDGNNECNLMSPAGTFILTIPDDGGVVSPNPQTVSLPTALPQVSGTIEHINGTGTSGMPNVDVVVLPNGGSSVDEITDSNGDYCSPGEEDEFYYLTPEYSGLDLCGVNTDDIDVIHDHLVASSPFDDEDHWKFLASDANQSESISAADLACLRQLILGTSNCDGNFVDWKFLDQDEYDNLDDNDGEDIFNIIPSEEEIVTSALGPLEDFDGGDFFAIKIGDVTSTWCDATNDLPTQYTSKDVSVRSKVDPAFLALDKNQVDKFSTKLDVYPSRSLGQVSMMAFSAEIEDVSIVNVEFHKKDQSSSIEYAVNKDGVLDFIWFTMAPDQHLWQAGTPIFTLHFDRPLNSIGQIQLTQNKVTPLLYTVQGRYPIILRDVESIDQVPKSSIALWPNPAMDRLHVSSENNVLFLAIEIFDMQGRMLFRKKAVQTTSTELDITSLIQGTYIVKIETKNGIHFERFIKQ